MVPSKNNKTYYDSKTNVKSISSYCTITRGPAERSAISLE